MMNIDEKRITLGAADIMSEVFVTLRGISDMLDRLDGEDMTDNAVQALGFELWTLAEKLERGYNALCLHEPNDGKLRVLT